MSEKHEQRLEKIEEKLDRLADAVVSIARIEERVATVLGKTIGSLLEWIR